MHAEEARQLLGFPPNSHPDPSQVKAAYKKKVWDYHPDRFPSPEKPLAESQFKSVTEAYSLLLSGGGHTSRSASYTRVVRTGVPNVQGGRRNRALSGMPFLLIVFGAVGLGGLNAASSVAVCLAFICSAVYLSGLIKRRKMHMLQITLSFLEETDTPSSSCSPARAKPCLAL